MVTLPKEFIQLDHIPGYYWHRVEKVLYSCKVNGVLKPLTFQKGFQGYVRGTKVDSPAGYSISVNGRKHRLTIEHILATIAKINANTNQTFPVEGK